MRLRNEVTVAAAADELFAFLSDVEQMAACLPGAAIRSRDGDEFVGAMKVKVGPITASYEGRIGFVELDERERRAVMRARATEVNGHGDAEATVTVTVADEGSRSLVAVETDLEVRGRVAQFGRGAMERISQRMFAEFARNLERRASGADGDAPPPGTGSGARLGAARDAPPRAGETLDAWSLLGGEVPPIVGWIAVWLLGASYGYLLGRLRRDR